MYSDPQDKLSDLFVLENIHQDYWDRSDYEILRHAAETFVPDHQEMTCFDFGAGRGRLIPVLTDLFDMTVGYEPDPKRFRDLSIKARELSLNHKYYPLNSIDKYSISHDVVVCSHVFQHLTESSIAACISTIQENILRKHRPLIVLTSASDSPACYLVSQVDEKVSAMAVCIEEFEERCAYPIDGLLPVRHFEISWLVRYLESKSLVLNDCIRYREFNFDIKQESNDNVTGKASDIALVLYYE